MESRFGIVYCILVILLYTSILILMGGVSISVIYKLKKRYIFIGVILLVSAFIHLQFVNNRNYDELFIADVLFVTAELAASIVCYIMYNRASKRRVGTHSVKQALDTLESGICYYRESGMVRLVNRKMNEMSETLCGRQAMNGNQLLELFSEKSEEFEGIGDRLFEFDNKVYQFVRNEISLKDEKLYELIVTDITEEYRRSKELEVKQRAAEKVSESFRDLAKQAQVAAMEREILQARINLHDEPGIICLLAKKYLESGSLGDLTEKDLVREWINTLEAIKRDAARGSEYDYDKARRTAQLLGAQLDAEEIFDDDRLKRSVVSQALVCALNNAVRHGKADRVWMSTQDEGGGKKLIVIDNNGTPAESESTEKGGLKNLRKNVEALGSEMKVLWDKSVEIRIVL